MNRKTSTKEESVQSIDVSRSVEEKVTKSLHNLNKVQAEIAAIARETLSGIVVGRHAAADEAPDTLGDIVKGAIQAAKETDLEIFMCLKRICEGLVVGVNDGGGDLSLAARNIIAHAVEEAVEVGVDAGTMAKACVIGVNDALKSIDADAETIIQQTIEKAIVTARAMEGGNAEAVEDVLAYTAGNHMALEKTVQPHTSLGSTPESRAAGSESEQWPFY